MNVAHDSFNPIQSVMVLGQRWVISGKRHAHVTRRSIQEISSDVIFVWVYICYSAAYAG